METSVRKDEKGKKQKFIFRINRVCACGSGKCGRTGKYLEVPVSRSERWRRAFSGSVPDFGADVRFYPVDDRSGYRQKDKTEPAHSIWKTEGEMEVPRSACLSDSSHYFAVLLCNWRMGSEVFYYISGRRWQQGITGWIFYRLYHTGGAAFDSDGDFPVYRILYNI